MMEQTESTRGRESSAGSSPRVRAVDAAETPPALEFTDVAKVFPDGTEAFRGVSLKLRAGDFCSLVGPSGCGKSTILRVAAGLLEPTSGQVGRRDNRVGFVFQEPTLLPWRSVQKNVELFLQLQGVPRQQRTARARAAIDLVGLEQFADHLPHQLSGGMKMRVSVARSLALSPPVFLFDEPFGALDEITRQRLNEELIRLFVHEKFAGLFVTHSIFEAVFLSTRVLVMTPRPGRIVATFDVPFPFPRTAGIRFDSAFSELASEVSASMLEAHE